MEWEAVIGLEIHAQLATKTKIFSGASTAFGAEPNTQACAIDLALPGTLPVFNKKALEMAVMFGTAINAEISKTSVFDRKNYFYPDSPKGYQTSQLFYPIVGLGELEINLPDGSTKVIGVTRAHLEEDAGKSLHEKFANMSGIDLNRAGTPLLEIVSEPDMSSAEEAVAYAKKIHAIVTSIGICDGNMAEGSFRVDCNVSVRHKGVEQLGNRTETKNINSFRFIEKAIKGEIVRQIEILEDGGYITQETRLYDAENDSTRTMRSKEEANDYRYFPCPDLLPIVIEDDYIEAIRNALPELPDARNQRFVKQYSLSENDANTLSGNKAQADFFESLTELSKDAKLSANWLLGEVAKTLNQTDLTIEESPVNASQLAELLIRIKDNTVGTNGAKQVFEAMWNNEGSADQIIADKGLKQVTDTGSIEKIVREVVAQNDKQVQQYVTAEPDKRGKMLGFFMGQIMKASAGKANPGQVQSLLKPILDELCD
ncbi:MAG: aspartyl-tRNA(Asn)/glutamyl-tRNA(Gln) amidotransferase subunit B [Oceanospirillaceae bacterium]|jgi:aspartyl-tRNA(Asn)/glutamyl-tRNA(Gln) amidotransferase subunit B